MASLVTRIQLIPPLQIRLRRRAPYHRRHVRPFWLATTKNNEWMPSINRWKTSTSRDCRTKKVDINVSVPTNVCSPTNELARRQHLIVSGWKRAKHYWIGAHQRLSSNILSVAAILSDRSPLKTLKFSTALISHRSNLLDALWRTWRTLPDKSNNSVKLRQHFNSWFDNRRKIRINDEYQRISALDWMEWFNTSSRVI